MKNKSETRTLLYNFVMYVKNQFHHNIKTIRSDNGKEFLFNELYDKFGILHQRYCVENPQQNSVIERKHQHILNITLVLSFSQVCLKLTGLMLLLMLFI